MDKASLEQSIYNPVLGQNSKGFLDNYELKSLRNNCSTAKILKGMEFRPDLVANYYLGSSELAWVITYVNDFFNGIKDYKLGRKIKIPNL